MGQPQNYPIPETGCLVSPRVRAFRGPEETGYRFLDEQFTFTMLSCAAVRNPRVSTDCRYVYGHQKEMMRLKVRAILCAAMESQCDVAILSAFGCGAYGNPPQEVAALFAEELERFPLFRVVFAIRDDHNAGRARNPEGNVAPFERALGVTGWRAGPPPPGP